MAAEMRTARKRPLSLRVEELSTYPSQLQCTPVKERGRPPTRSEDEPGSSVTALTSQLAESGLGSHVRESQALRLLERAEREAKEALQREQQLAERLCWARRDLLRVCLDEPAADNDSAVSVQLSSEAQFIAVEEPQIDRKTQRQLSAGQPPSLRTDMRTVRAQMMQLQDFFQACEHSRSTRSKPLRTPTA